MKKWQALAALALALFPIQVFAQRTASNPLGGNISVQDAGTCSTTNSFLWQVLPVNAGTTTLNLAGTFSATVTVRASNNGGGSWATLGTVSSAGTTTYSTNGYTDFCADVTTYSSGTVQISIATGLQQVQSVVSGNSGGSFSSLSGLPWIDPRTYGAKFNAGFNSAATTTSGQPTVTCSGCKFLTGAVGTNTPPAAVGQTFFATLSASGNPGGSNACLDNALITFGGLNETTVASIQSDTQLTVVGNSNTSATALACIAWGTDDTTALNNAWAAGGCVPSIHAPVGNTIFSAAIFQNPAGCTGGVQNGYTGGQIWGTAVGNTDFIPIPDIPTAGFTNISYAKSLFGGSYVQDYENFSIFGLGVRAPAALAGVTLALNLCSGPPGCREVNFAGVGWWARPQSGGGNSVAGSYFADATNGFNWSGYNYFGSTSVFSAATLIYMGSSFISGNPSATTGTCPVILQANSTSYSVNNLINACVSVGAGGNGGTLVSVNTTVNANDPSSGFCMYMPNNSQVMLLGNDQICTGATGTESAVDFQGTNAIYRMHGSTHIGASGAVFTFTGAASNFIIDEGGNSITNGGSGRWNGLGTWMNGGSTYNQQTPTLTGFGTSPSVTHSAGTSALSINVGTGGTATSGTLTFAAAANAGWVCNANDITNPGVNFTKQSGGSTTTAVLTNYNSAGTATAWTASDIVNVDCQPQ